MERTINEFLTSPVLVCLSFGALLMSLGLLCISTDVSRLKHSLICAVINFFRIAEDFPFCITILNWEFVM